MSHAGIFFVEREQPRVYKAVHLPTRRKFQLIKASPTNQLWTVFEIVKDKRSKYRFAESRKSKKDALDQTLLKLKVAKKKANKKPVSYKSPQTTGPTRFRPSVFADLKIKKLSETRWLYLAKTQETFLITKRADSWKCVFADDTDSQPIAVGMLTKELALLELYYYLDVPLSEMSANDVKNYRKDCFKPRPSRSAK